MERRKAINYSYIRSTLMVHTFSASLRLIKTKDFTFLHKKFIFRVFWRAIISPFPAWIYNFVIQCLHLYGTRMTIWTKFPQVLEIISVFNSLLIRNKNKFRVFFLAAISIVIVQCWCALQLQKYSIQKMIGCDKMQQMIS